MINLSDMSRLMNEVDGSPTKSVQEQKMNRYQNLSDHIQVNNIVSPDLGLNYFTKDIYEITS